MDEAAEVCIFDTDLFFHVYLRTVPGPLLSVFSAHPNSGVGVAGFIW